MGKTTNNFKAVALKFSQPQLMVSLASSVLLRLSHLNTLLHKTKNTSMSLYFLFLRRGRDSNSRYPFGYSSFQDWCIQPLCHLSNIFCFQDAKQQICKWCIQSQVFSCWKISRPRLGTVVPLPLVYSMSSQTNTLPPLQIGCVNYTTGK